MEDYDPKDIIATIKFKNELIKIQDEFKTAIKTGEHPDGTLQLWTIIFIKDVKIFIILN